MATLVFFNDFKEQIGKEVHNLSADALKIALTNTGPTAGTDVALSDITQIATGGGYSAGGSTVSGTAWSQSGAQSLLKGNALTFTGTTGGMASFRYYVLYNDAATSPTDALICYWDHGTGVTLGAGETFQIKFNNATSSGTIFTMS